MNKSIKTFFQFLFLALVINCKTDSFQKKRKIFSELKSATRLIDENEKIIIDSVKIKMTDTVETNVKRFTSKIETDNFFVKSKTKVKVTFYNEDSLLKFITIKEESNKYQDTDKYIDYLVTNNSITNFQRYYGWQSGMAMNIDKNYEEQVGLNTFLNNDFYKYFSIKLYNAIKNEK